MPQGGISQCSASKSQRCDSKRRIRYQAIQAKSGCSQDKVADLAKSATTTTPATTTGGGGGKTTTTPGTTTTGGTEDKVKAAEAAKACCNKSGDTTECSQGWQKPMQLQKPKVQLQNAILGLQGALDAAKKDAADKDAAAKSANNNASNNNRWRWR